YKTSQLKNEQYLVIVTSTYGEGEPPENAIGLHNFLFSKKAPKLTGLKYAVLGLGDTSYEFFCKTAQDFDSRLAELGAVSVQARADLDVDYQVQADSWSSEVIAKLEPELKAATAPSAQVIAWPGSDTTAGSVSQYNKQSPFAA